MKLLKSSSHLAKLALAMAMVVAGFSAATVSAEEAESAGNSMTITATDHHFDAPDQVEAGFVNVTLVNEGESEHHAQLARLNDDVTFDDIMAMLQEGDEAALFQSISFTGGPGLILPGQEQTVILDLEPGQYFLICFVADENGVPHFAQGMIEPFEVVAATTPDVGEAPEADATIDMLDFAFSMPSELEAGQYIWEVVNEGVEPHEIILAQVTPGVTAEEALAALEAMIDPEAEGEAPDGPPPFMPIGGMQGLETGMTGWLMVDLEPGEYIALCFIPSPEHGGAPHFALGMVASLSVTGDAPADE